MQQRLICLDFCPDEYYHFPSQMGKMVCGSDDVYPNWMVDLTVIVGNGNVKECWSWEVELRCLVHWTGVGERCLFGVHRCGCFENEEQS